jgi:hypothetical protein
MKQLLSSQLRSGSFEKANAVLLKKDSSSASYESLQNIVEQISIQTQLCERSLAVENKYFARHILKAKKSVFSWVGKEYEIPTIEESFTNQLGLVLEYNGCLDILIRRGELELNQLQDRIDELEVYSLNSEQKIKQFDAELRDRLSEYESHTSRKSRRNVVHAINELGLRKIHTDISLTVLKRLDSLEQFLTDAVFTTKKLREEGRGYEHFLYSAIRPYLALGINTKCVSAISEQMDTMKQFTNQVELHVANSLAHIQLLSHQSYSANTEIGKKASTIESNRMAYLKKYHD